MPRFFSRVNIWLFDKGDGQLHFHIAMDAARQHLVSTFYWKQFDSDIAHFASFTMLQL